MKRKKTTVTLPYDILHKIDEAAEDLGIGRNAFLSVASVFLLAELTRIRSPKRRGILIRELERMFQKIVAEVKNVQ